MRILVVLLLSLSTAGVQAKLHKEVIEYRHGSAILEAYLVYDDDTPNSRPGVLVIHEWKGLGNYAKMRADRLAQLGYVAFALDMYGKGIRPATNEEASTQAGKYYKDRQLMRSRAQTGLDQLRKHPLVDSARIGVIGYCFGGAAALELARSGAPLAGVVSFHGTLDTPTPEDAKNIKGKVLVCHGGSDPYVTADAVAGFESEMTKAGVDFQLNIYGGAVHSFSNPESGNDPSKGAAYDERADKRSWSAMRLFFDEVFR